MSAKQLTSGGTQGYQARDICPKCGAIRTDSQIGLEPTLNEYVSQMVDVFRAVKRILRPDGTLWLNLGDSYNAAGRTGHGTRIGFKQGTNRASAEGADTERASDESLKPKDLLMVPARVALALQADGWYLRSDIIWAKDSCMPESVTDRPTSSYEHVFLLTKSEKYYYDAEAISEEGVIPAGTKFAKGSEERAASGANARPAEYAIATGRRNSRNVWRINPKPFPEAHFATMPPELAEKCLLAGTKPGDMVLDPFSGAGTTLLVADRLRRSGVGIELNPAYVKMSQDRLHQDAGMFAEIL